MKRLIIALLAVLLMTMPAQAYDWSKVFNRINLSVVQLFHSRGVCTAFSINRAYKHYLTAAHCLGEDMRMWKETTPGIGMQHTFDVVTVRKSSRELDVAVLEATEGLAAIPRGQNPVRGNEVASIGYAFGEEAPFILSSITASVKTVRAYSRARLIILKDNQDIGGMSGGPVVDTRGKLVGMVQMGINTNNGQQTNIAYGTAVSDIYAFVKDYWER